MRFRDKCQENKEYCRVESIVAPRSERYEDNYISHEQRQMSLCRTENNIDTAFLSDETKKNGGGDTVDKSEEKTMKRVRRRQ